MTGEPAVLLVPPQLRQTLARFMRSVVPSMHVLAWNEIPDNRKVRLVTAVGEISAGMKIKHYRAADMRQALRQVREAQGPDAVILSSRRDRRAASKSLPLSTTTAKSMPHWRTKTHVRRRTRVSTASRSASRRLPTMPRWPSDWRRQDHHANQ